MGRPGQEIPFRFFDPDGLLEIDYRIWARGYLSIGFEDPVVS